MFKTLGLLVLFAAGLVAAAPGAMAQGKRPPASAAACPTYPTGEVGSSLTCSCDLTGIPGAVWGSGPYTSDSSICAAGVHAGIVDTIRGPGDTIRYVGEVALEVVAGCEEYRGTEANGITTRDYGSWSLSFYFPGMQGSECAGGVDEAQLCPNGLQAGVESLTCTCTASDTQIGTVWGTGIYTDDSALCRAALHAGAVGAAGGIVTVVRMAGQDAYAASSQNGIDSLAYGNWRSSITFTTATATTKGGGAAPTVPTAPTK